MNTEHILDAIGLLDDDLIREAEEYSRPRVRHSYGTWLGLAASFAVVLALGYGAVNLGGGGNKSCTASSAQLSGGAECLPGEPVGGGTEGENNACDSLQPTPEPSASAEFSQNGGDVFQAAIMVDGVLYWSTGRPFSGEVDGAQNVTAYINTVPEMDGQTNFSQDLSARYAMTDQGLAVEMDGVWVLFETVPAE
ncbi:MAG: hypothetical protein HFF47_08870 [Lawsonibacter sp.]|nr:hypothetical protein [Lawsonibacter sp.]